jgi:hypothetical protein
MSPVRTPDELLRIAGLGQLGHNIDCKGRELRNLDFGKSVIYDAWVRYTRKPPDRVFAP